MKILNLALTVFATAALLGSSAQAFEAKQITFKKFEKESDLKIVLVDGVPYATYQFFQAEEMPFDSSILGAIVRTCPTTRKEASEGALALCARNGGVDCRIATMFKQVEKVSTQGDNGKPAIAVQCVYNTYVIDLHNSTDQVSVYDESGPMYP